MVREAIAILVPRTGSPARSEPLLVRAALLGLGFLFLFLVVVLPLVVESSLMSAGVPDPSGFAVAVATGVLKVVVISSSGSAWAKPCDTDADNAAKTTESIRMGFFKSNPLLSLALRTWKGKPLGPCRH